MRCGLHKALAALGSMAVLSGCVQMTRHSNMMIFGTNTVVGVRAGVNATSVPEVAIGYARQEAVILPLVANTASNDGANGSKLNRLSPCDFQKTPVSYAGQQGFIVHPCSLVGINRDGKMLDSYSVLASFGGSFGGTATAGNPNASASAGVAQYFATGLAAQTLALNGGAAVVAAGSTAERAAAKSPMTLEGVTVSSYGAVDPAGITLQNYLGVADKTEQLRRWTLAQKVETALGKSSDKPAIADLLMSDDGKGQQALLSGLLVAEDQPAGLTILKGK